MSEKSGGKVVVYVGAKTEEFQRKIKQTKTELQQFGDSAKSLKGAFSTAFAGIAAAAGSLAFVKKSIESIEGPGDNLKKVMAGGKESLYELQKAVATIDFSNLIDNLVKGFTRGRDFEGAIDDLADKIAYNDFKISELNQESKRLQEITKNKELELSVRKQAAAELEQVERQILDRKIKISQEEYNIEAQNWTDKNTESEIGIDQAVKLYEDYNNLTEDQLDKLALLYAKKTQAYDLGNPEAPMGGFTRQELYAYTAYSKLLAEGETDVIVKLFALKSKAANAAADAQERYNSILRQTSTLEVTANPQISSTSAVAAVAEAPFSYGNFGGKMSSELNNQLGALTDPTLAQRVSNNFKAISAGLTPELEKMKAKMLDFKQSVAESFESLIEGTIIDFASAMGSAMASGNWEGFGAAMLASLGRWAKQFGSLLIASGIAIKALKTPDPTGATQIVAGIALVAIGAALSQIASSAPTGGGSSSGNSPGVSSYSNSSNSNHTMELIWRRAGKDLVAILNYENASLKTITGKK